MVGDRESGQFSDWEKEYHGSHWKSKKWAEIDSWFPQTQEIGRGEQPKILSRLLTTLTSSSMIRIHGFTSSWAGSSSPSAGQSARRGSGFFDSGWRGPSPPSHLCLLVETKMWWWGWRRTWSPSSGNQFSMRGEASPRRVSWVWLVSERQLWLGSCTTMWPSFTDTTAVFGCHLVGTWVVKRCLWDWYDR